MLAIRLPQSIEKRLDKLARRTGRTKSFYIRKAILEHLENIEDLYLAEGSLDRIRSGKESAIRLKAEQHKKLAAEAREFFTSAKAGRTKRTKKTVV